MQPGDVVKFASPFDAAEATHRFRVVELRGDRVLVQCTDSTFRSWWIKPRSVYLVADLLVTGEGDRGEGSAIRPADELPERDFWEGDSPDY